MESINGRNLAQNREVYTKGCGKDIYRVSFHPVLTSMTCPVEGWPEKSHTLGRLKKHFIYRHWKAQVAIVQEGLDPLPQFPSCGMHMHAVRLIKHQMTDRCNQGIEMRLCRRNVDTSQKSGEIKFSLYDR